MKTISERESKLKSLFEYTDYRTYLRDYYENAKSTRRSSFSFRLFSRLCGFKSPNFLMLVMNGKSALSSVSVEKVIQGLKFNKEESDFFRNLVAFNEAKTSEKKTHHARQLMRSKSYREIFQLSEAQYRYLGVWYYPVIRSVIGLQGFNGDLAWVARQMRPELTIEQVTAAVEELIQLGLLKRDSRGRLSQSERMVGTASEITSSFAADYHKQMLQKGSESIDRFPRTDRHLVGSTVAMSHKAIEKAKALAEQFRTDIMELAEQQDPADSIYQVSFQIFPLFVGKDKK